MFSYTIGDPMQAHVNNAFMAQRQRTEQAANLAYKTLATDQDQIAADAQATRARNMGRIDAYGQSMRNDIGAQMRQAMAAANQSAIKRGLGNTTIADSLSRGVAYDGQRQLMTLEDQLLQNRVATDSQLSGAYQNVLMNRANALNNQANQSITYDNALGQSQLASIQQMLQMQNANQQAELDRFASNPYLQRQRLYQSGMLQPVQIGIPRTLG